jgi:hypothetical protein
MPSASTAAPDGFWVHDRHNCFDGRGPDEHPQAGLLPAGQGWHIDSKNVVNVPIGGAKPYELPVAKWLISAVFQGPDGRTEKRSGIYVFWFVADGEQTPEPLRLFMKLLRAAICCTGVLQRWAYVSYFSTCAPGQEDATFGRMEKLIAASVPEFQPPPSGRERLKRI